MLVGTAPDTTTATASFRASGGMSDIRVAGTYAIYEGDRRWLRVGLAYHALGGTSRAERQVLFNDVTRFSSFREQQLFSFSGKGVSAGLDWRPVRALALAASARTGGTVSAWNQDTVKSRGRYPARAGAALQFLGLAGTVIAVRADWNQWSRLSGLSLTGVKTHDAWDYSVGAETKGPRLFDTDLPLRAGVRRRTLPFGVPGGGEVRELGIAGGLGLPLAGNRADVDLTVERDARTAPGTVKERAWIFSFGLLVRL
jgi:hypothetical protein